MPDAEVTSIAEYHTDVVSALRLYFSSAAQSSPNPRNSDAIVKLLSLRLRETDQRSAFFVMARLEAAFRVDYECRCRLRMKDELSKAFRRLWKLQTTRVSLDEDLFDLWKAHVSASRQLISELRGAFKFRHWLAHGRYWKPKLGRSKYDFDYVYDLAEAVFASLPLCAPE